MSVFISHVLCQGSGKSRVRVLCLMHNLYSLFAAIKFFPPFFGMQEF